MRKLAFFHRVWILICLLAVVPIVWSAMECFARIMTYTSDSALTEREDIGVMALRTLTLLRIGCENGNSVALQGLQHLEECVRPDGGIYSPQNQSACYETCLAMMCFAEANAEGRYDAIVRRAYDFLTHCQWDENRGQEATDAFYGGIGIGKGTPPDLISTTFLLDTLHSCKRDSSDPAIKKALIFVSRCQNIATPISTADSPKNSHGGFRDTCDLSGASPVYGMTTFFGLKSMLDAGVERDDKRIADALDWIRKNYDMRHHPGAGSAGLYHYYHVCAKTLLALGVDVIEDDMGVKHVWRNEICTELVRRQRGDGSWINENGYLGENDPRIATAHALLAISYCRQQTPRSDAYSANTIGKTKR